MAARPVQGESSAGEPAPPPALKPGDLVGIAAPASPVREELLRRGEERLMAQGLRIRRSPHLLARSRYSAGTVHQRAADLNEFFRDPEVRAVIAARGGYGSPPLLPLLDAAAYRTDPKPIVGASDVTALLLWALKLGVRALHGPMPARELQAQDDAAGAAAVVSHLTQVRPAGEIPAPALRTLHPGWARGRLTGGCLSLVIAGLATPWEIETRDTLLFLEDVNTKPYQIDRMLTQLRQAGKLERISGLVFGEMPGCLQVADQGYSLDEVLHDLTADLGIPVLAGLPCGHVTGLHQPLPVGVRAELCSDPPALRLLEPLVA